MSAESVIPALALLVAVITLGIKIYLNFFKNK